MLNRIAKETGMSKAARPTRWGEYLLNAVGLGFLGIVVGLPLVNIFYQALAQGLVAYSTSLQDPDALHAIGLTLVIMLATVPINTAFGIFTAWLLARHRFPGKSLILGLIDLPLTISPVIVGLMFILLYSQTDSLFQTWVLALNVKIIFALPGMILVTLFITLPFVVREVLPALESMGAEQEEAAQTLGANSWQTFWRVVLPNIRWAVLYGVVLCTARALGEFGAVAVVSGKIIHDTNTLTLHVERVYMEYQTVAAFACASLLTLFALITLVCQEIVRHLGDAHSN
jgi:sulfate/thiosulfate transport system permease protein